MTLSNICDRPLGSYQTSMELFEKQLTVYYSYNQGSFISEMEWAPILEIKCLFWNANDSIAKLMVSMTK